VVACATLFDVPLLVFTATTEAVDPRHMVAVKPHQNVVLVLIRARLNVAVPAVVQRPSQTFIPDWFAPPAIADTSSVHVNAPADADGVTVAFVPAPSADATMMTRSPTWQATPAVVTLGDVLVV
jgi:hypothetical protein